MVRRIVVFGVLLLVIFAFEPANRASQQQPSDALDLESLFNPVTGVVRDTNGAGLPDAIAARVIVPARPAPEDVLGAATIAARLGHETSAMTLPIVVRDSEVGQPASVGVPILVGRENQFVKRLIAQGSLDLKALKPGQGLVAMVHSPFGGGDA